jgi:hypothetical protein
VKEKNGSGFRACSAKSTLTKSKRSPCDSPFKFCGGREKELNLGDFILQYHGTAVNECQSIRENVQLKQQAIPHVSIS